ncbi:MAG: UDP-N-acetylmuramoyl-L-alanine--D-glutamate ligase [Bacteroidales bacterium]|jgi:UDP-N-acetylmuramoylalanine--D-glutamate ligase|nr:UDP-N-acetylmuramoyl-L-alanine--D-glutamate ligase [Bacteroidales bacterium]
MYAELNNLIQFLKGKKILISGFGREGISTLRFLQKYVTDVQITVYDQNAISLPEDCKSLKINVERGEKCYCSPQDFDIMLKSPGISLDKISSDWILQGKLSSQTELLLRFFGHKTIGITGTKGKSTTTTLIYHILNYCGKEAVLAGNMGLPFLDKIAETQTKLIVAELSSHQLEKINYAPHIAILLNIFPEHLDHYESFMHYAMAKWNIGTKQTKDDFLIIQSDWIKSEWADCISNSRGNICFFGLDNGKAFFEINKQKIHVEIDKLKSPLKGEHNLINIASAIAASYKAGVSVEKAVESLYSFQPLPHRLEFVREWHGVKFINDSISTIPQSAIAAINSYPSTETIILGGFNRGINYDELIDFLILKDIKNVVLMGEVGDVLGSKLKEKKFKNNLFYAKSMEEVVKIASENTQYNKVCMFSPAAASYDKYINFEYRGNDFKKYVNDL